MQGRRSGPWVDSRGARRLTGQRIDDRDPVSAFCHVAFKTRVAGPVDDLASADQDIQRLMTRFVSLAQGSYRIFKLPPHKSIH